MKNGIWWTIIILLLAVIVALSWVLFTTPTPAKHPSATTTPPVTQTTTDTSQEPLHTRVVVNSPKSGATVAPTFTVSGKAPGNWYFEASFPLQVRDANDNVIGRGLGQAQGDWMTTAQVPFKATITIEKGFSGPATLILLKDNPSGLPENDDSLEVPIVIQ